MTPTSADAAASHELLTSTIEKRVLHTVTAFWKSRDECIRMPIARLLEITRIALLCMHADLIGVVTDSWIEVVGAGSVSEIALAIQIAERFGIFGVYYAVVILDRNVCDHPQCRSTQGSSLASVISRGNAVSSRNKDHPKSHTYAPHQFLTHLAGPRGSIDGSPSSLSQKLAKRSASSHLRITLAGYRSSRTFWMSTVGLGLGRSHVRGIYPKFTRYICGSEVTDRVWAFCNFRRFSSSAK